MVWVEGRNGNHEATLVKDLGDRWNLGEEDLDELEEHRG